MKIQLSIGTLLLFALAACSASVEAPPTLEAEAAVVEATVAPVEAEEEEEAADVSMRTFVIVPEESKASYTVEEEFFAGALGPLGIDAGFNTAFGWTRNIEGQISVDLNETPPTVADSSFVVNIRSLSSDNDRRDEMIQRRFLESNVFPTAEFVVTAIENFPSDWSEGEQISFTLIGDLTIREISQPFSFDVEGILEGDTLTGTAIGSLTTTDFGFQPPSIAGILTVSDPAMIMLEFVMRE